METNHSEILWINVQLMKDFRLLNIVIFRYPVASEVALTLRLDSIANLAIKEKIVNTAERILLTQSFT